MKKLFVTLLIAIGALTASPAIAQEGDNDVRTQEGADDDGDSGKLGLLGLVGLIGLAGLARRDRRDDRGRNYSSTASGDADRSATGTR